MSLLLVQGSAHAIPLRDESVQTVVTSPPYWGLREYAGEQSFVWGGDADHEHEWEPYGRQAERYTGKRKWQHLGEEAQAAGMKIRDVDPNAWGHPQVESEAWCACGAWNGALGLEPTPDLYVEHMVAIFREVRRVLRPDGTAWLNLGDSYATQGGAGTQGHNGQRASRTFTAAGSSDKGVPPGLKPKDLIGIPWRVALALQADGWWLRAEIIWSKSNPMPESITDRPTRSHEQVFLLAKSGDATYWTHRDGDFAGARSRPEPDYRWVEPRPDDAPLGWAPDESREAVEDWRRVNLWRGHDYFYDADAIREPLSDASLDRIAQPTFDQQSGGPKDYGGNRSARKGLENLRDAVDAGRTGRNKRTVWSIATRPYPGAHFATFPEDLVEPCVLAGSARQACGECGAPWERVVERGREPDRPGRAQTRDGDAERHGADGRDGSRYTGTAATTGYRPTCDHEDGSGQSVVLDPFCGTSTVGRVALRNGRRYVGIDLSREYLAEHSRARLRGVVTAVQEKML